MTPDSILDLCAPPEGYRFVRGVWVAHDVSWSLVTDTVAPILAGVVGEDRRRRYRAARAIEGADLLVLASAGRETPGPIHTWARLGTVYRRVQHAKMAVLQFQGISGVATVTRAFIASANLTQDGLLHNREVLLSDEVSGRARRPSIVLDVVDALKELAATDGMELVASDLKSSLTSIGDALPTQLSRAGQLEHSLASPVAIIDALKPSNRRSVRRLVIVSPGHSVDGTTLVEHLAATGLVAPGVSVEIHTGGRAKGERDIVAASFSPSLVQQLRDRGAAVSLYVVPEVETVGQRDRRRHLHAKLVASVDNAGTVLSLVGSANCSPSGWLGANREAMVRQQSSKRDLDAFIAELGATPASLSPVSPPPMPTRQSVGPPPPALPEFEPRRTAGGELVGRVNLGGFKAAGFRVLAARLGGKTVAVEDLEAGVVPIPERNAVLDLQIRNGAAEARWHRFQLAGGPPDINPQIWRADPDEPPERVDAWLIALLGDVHAAASAPRLKGSPGRGKVAEPDDAYRIPLQRRLALIARYREDLKAGVLPDELHEAVNRLLDDPNEQKIANMLLFGDVSDDALLEAVLDVASGNE